MNFSPESVENPVRRGKRAAFTLVEVVLAVGIFVFSATAILGLLPVALKAGRDSLDMAVATQLADSLAEQLFRTDFSQLPGVGSRFTNWFDDSGTETNQASAVYVSSTQVQGSESPNLRRIAITVQRGGSGRTFCYLRYNDQ